jgi:hypothetical protein
MKHKISFREFLFPNFRRISPALTFKSLRAFCLRNFYALALLILWLVVFLLKEL